MVAGSCGGIWLRRCILGLAVCLVRRRVWSCVFWQWSDAYVYDYINVYKAARSSRVFLELNSVAM